MSGQVNRITAANSPKGVAGARSGGGRRSPTGQGTRAHRSRSVPCPYCGGRTRDGLLCKTCITATSDRLAALPGWWVELQRTVTRQARLTPPGAGRSATKPLPFNPVASAVADRVRHGVTTSDAVRNGLVGWVRITVEDLGAPWPTKGITDLCEHLVAWLPALRKHEAAVELAADVWGWSDAISRAVDYPDVRAKIKVGPCPEVCADGEPCAGWVWAIIPEDRDADVFAACDSCAEEDAGRGVWAASQWRKMGRRIAERRAQIAAQIERARPVG